MNSIREWAFKVCDSAVPSVQGDDVFEVVTQGRQAPGYSSCADLAHSLLEALGVRDPIIVNRNGEWGARRWQPGVNISKLRNGGRQLGVWVDYAPFLVPKLCDIVLIGNYSAGENEHVLVFRELAETERSGTWWTSYDYGQVQDETGKPCSTICTRHRVGNRLDGREIIGWVDLDKLQAKGLAHLT